MNFIGRKNELGILKQTYNNNKSNLIVLYGRRRVGKSRLLLEHVSNKISFSFEGPEGVPTAKQIEYFKEQMARIFNDPWLLKVDLPNWNRAFEFFTEKLKKMGHQEKIIIIFDEIQWMANLKSELISLIKFFWDQYWKYMNLDLILCGSIASFMMKKIIKSKALYGRIDCELRLLPLRPSEVTLLFDGKRSLDEILLYQMILGRIPKYFELIDKKRSFEININSLCFQSNGVLVSEMEKIFYSQFKKDSRYNNIIKSLASGRKTLNEISLETKTKSGGGLKEYLTNLELAQFIRSEVSFEKKQNSKAKRYELTDEFLIFHKKFIEPNMKFILKNEERNLFTSLVKENWNSWLGFSFERFCKNNAEYLATKMGFIEKVIDYGPYFQKNPGTQIDLLYRRSDNVIVLCEMKYSKHKISQEIFLDIEKKVERLKIFKNYTIEKALIAPYGADKELLKLDYFNYILTLEDILMP